MCKEIEKIIWEEAMSVGVNAMGKEMKESILVDIEVLKEVV